MSKNKPDKSKLNQNDSENNEDISLRINQFISLIDDLPYGTVLNHKDGIYFNKAVEEMIGYTNDEIKDIDEWFKILYKKDAETVKNTYLGNRGNNFESEVIVDVVTKSGQIRKIAFKDKITPIGEIWGLKDKTELYKAREEKDGISQEFNQLLDFSKIGLWEWVIEDDKLTWNNNMYEIYGFEEVGVVSKYDDYKDRLHPDDIEAMTDDLNYVLNNSIEEFNNSFRVVLKDGTIKKIKAVAKAYRDEEGKLVKMIGLNWDVTEEEALNSQKDKIEKDYKFILDSLNMGVWDWDINSDKLILNDKMNEILGFNINNKVSSFEKMAELLHPDDIESMKDKLSNVIKSPDKEYESTFRIIINDGTLKYIRSISKSYRDEHGVARRMIGLNWDITREIQQKEESKEQAEKYNFILSSLKIGVWDWDIKPDIMKWSDTMYGIYGFEVNDKFSNMYYFQSVLHQEDLERVKSEVDLSINTPNKEFESTFRIIKDKEIRYIHAISRAYRNEDGIATRMVGLNRDVTKEIQHKEERKELTERYDFILNSIEVGIWDWDIKPDIMNWNDTMFGIHGFEVNNKFSNMYYFQSVVHPEDLERVNSEIDFVINTPNKEFDSTYRIIKNKGDIIYIRAISRAYRNEDGIATRMVGLNWDVTKEIQQTEERKELIEKYELILNSTQIGVWDWDVKNNKITRSKTIFELFEIQENADDSFETSFSRFEEKIHPDDKELLKSNMEKIISGNIAHFESEIRIVTPSGSIKHLKSITNNEKDEKGNLLRIYGIHLDNTNIKESELQLVEAKEEAEAANKSKSEFLANMSHEIRTPMNAIMGLTYLTLKTDLDNKQKDYLNKIQKSSASLLGILNDILDFSKVEAGKLELEKIEFELEDILESVSDIITHKADEKGLEVIFSVNQDVPRHIISDPLRIKQILLNLCSNALKFTENGEILVEIEKVDTKSDNLELKVIVTDTGIGMKEEQIKKLFKSFSQADNSTTRKYGGSGLGLAISKNLVQLLGGKIGVESKYGKGSKFFFTFKCKVSNVESNKKQIPQNGMIGMKVLVCDDNKSLRSVLREILTSFTFEVTTVDNGFDAIEEIKNAKIKPYDLVILDWEMPGMDGIDTATEINELNLTKIPTIIMLTAHKKEDFLEKATELKLDAFLLKPIKSSVLFDTIIKLFKPEKNGKILDFKNQVNDDTIFDRFVGKKVLLAEDNEINQLVANELLSNTGMLVEIANNGEEAIQMLRIKSYDIVLMDLHMPVKDGYEATKEIRKLYNSTELPIIAMTADAMSGVKEECLKVGMDDFLAKPINPSKLFDVLSNWLSSGLNKEINLDNKKNNKLDINNEIDGIDLEFGLNIVGGNEKLYIQLLRKFNQIYHDFFEDFLSHSDIDITHTIRQIHTLKAVSGNIGAKKLYELADKYNNLLNEGFIPDQENMKDLKLELDKVLKSTSEYINTLSESNLSTNISGSILEKKNELESLLKANDYNSIKVIKDILKSSEHLKYEKEFKLIHKHITEYEFDKALLELKKLI